MNGQVAARRDDLDAAKGVLIALVVLGHNYYFSYYAVFWFTFLYGFHVASFLLLPFLFRYESMRPAAYLARLYRILVPQVAFLSLVIPIYYAMFVMDRPVGADNWLAQLSIALLLQTETQLETVTGFRHFWFLPAMAVLISLLWFVDKARPWPTAVLVAVLIAWHVSAGEIDSNSFQFFPWATAIVGFLFVPGLVVRGLFGWSDKRWFEVPLGIDILLLATWLLLAWLVLQYRLFMPLAGDLYQLISGWRQPARLLFQDAFLLVSFLFVLRLGWWLRRTPFVAVGRESLRIFLLSPLVWQLFWMTGGQHLVAETVAGSVLLVCASFAATIAVSYWIGRAVGKTPLNALVFPRQLPFAKKNPVS